MALAPGTRLGPYEILAAIGAGGMGEVYRATDTSLGRQVAIKVLPDAFAQDAERLARFEREAKTLASLNHPHIAQIYGLERSSGVQALVMELVEGEDLSQRIARGPIPLDEALPIARQIAEALEAAHEQGIIHRDLKPANIKLRSDGTVKVLDFGLAKLAERSGSPPSNLSLSPTITSPAMMTGVGVLLGTAAYMSPEQAKGRPADKRSDIWAFGCVLFEMLTGRRAFDGEDVSETLAFVLTRAPEWTALPADIPPLVRRLLKRALAKDRRDRLADIADARPDLIDVDSTSDAATMPAHARSWPRRLATIAGIVVAGFVLTVAVTLYFAREGSPQQSIKFAISAPSGLQFLETSAPAAVSPNGRFIVFRAGAEASVVGALWIRSLDSLDARALPGTEGASTPFWSPDSRSIGFVAGGKLMRVEATGTAPQVIADGVGTQGGGTWNQGGTIIFPGERGLLRVSASGGPTQIVTTVAPDEVWHRWPYFLPDGRRFVYLAAQTGDPEPTVYLASLGSSERIRVGSSNSKAEYAPGYLLFVRGRVLVASRFDAATGQLTGEPLPLAAPISFTSTSATFVASAGAAAFSVSANGVLAFRTGDRNTSQLQWFDRSGAPAGTIGDPGSIRQFNLSPDEKQVAVEQVEPQTGSSDIWLGDITRGIFTRFTFDPAIVADPTWSPDGTKVVFARGGGAVLVEKSLDGGTERALKPIGAPAWPDDWSRDGRFIAYVSPVDGRVLGVLPMTADGKPSALIDSPFTKDQPQFSPDGKWLAYNSDESGRTEVYVQPFPGPGVRLRISTAGGSQPRWSRDGRELFYLSTDGMLMSVATGVPVLAPGAPQPLFQTRINVATRLDQYAVTGDGQRFLMLVPITSADETPVTVIVNWPSLFTRN